MVLGVPIPVEFPLRSSPANCEDERNQTATRLTAEDLQELMVIGGLMRQLADRVQTICQRAGTAAGEPVPFFIPTPPVSVPRLQTHFQADHSPVPPGRPAAHSE